MDYKNTVFDVLDYGEVELIDKLGNELSIVNAAKVSFASYLSEMDEQAIGLLKFLLKNKHATPFEHVIFKFRIKAPIFVAREWFRHRWSSFNEMSMRYHVPPVNLFYIPEPGNIRRQVGKPGAYSFEPVNNSVLENEVIDAMSSAYGYTESVYRQLLELGIAKEVARAVLPVGQYTEFIWTVNLRSLINFLSLRNEKSAQFEIKEYAAVIENIIKDLMPITYETFIETDRQAI